MDPNVLIAAGAIVIAAFTGWRSARGGAQRGAEKASERVVERLDNGIKASLERIESKVDTVGQRLDDHVQAHRWNR